MMNRRIGRRTGIFLGALLGASAIVLTLYSFKIAMVASRAIPNHAAVDHAAPHCR